VFLGGGEFARKRRGTISQRAGKERLGEGGASGQRGGGGERGWKVVVAGDSNVGFKFAAE